MRARAAVFASGLGLAQMVWSIAACAAQPTEPLDTVRFQVESAREVANDRLRATLAAQASGADPAALAEQVNQTMAWALAQVPPQGVSVQSGDYHTFPVGERPLRWRVMQTVELESTDSAALATLVGRLQERLTLNSLTFSLSEERRRGVEEELIAEGIEQFGRRARHIAALLGATGYRLLSLEVNTPPTVGPMALAMESRAAGAPALQPGTTRLQVVIAGAIRLQREAE